MIISRLLPILLIIVLAVVSVGYLTGAIGGDNNDSGNNFWGTTPTPTPDSSQNISATPTSKVTPVSTQVNEIVTAAPVVTAAIAVPTVSDTPPAYYVHLNDTMQYNTSTSRVFDLDVINVPFTLAFSFTPGTVKKTYIEKHATSVNVVRYEVWNPATGKYGSITQTEPRYLVKSAEVIDPNAWFTITVIRIYEDPAQYAAAVSAAGGKEKLAEKKLLYEDNGIIIEQDGYSRGYSSETEKDLKLLSSGHYIVQVTGNQILANIQMFSP